MGVNPN